MSASISKTLPQFTVASSVNVRPRASVSSTLPQFSVAIAASPAAGTPTADINKTLPQFTSVFAVSPHAGATFAYTLPQFTPVLTAARRNDAAIAVSLPSFTAELTAVVLVSFFFDDVRFNLNLGSNTYTEEGHGGVVIPSYEGAYVYDDPAIVVGSSGAVAGGGADIVFPLNVWIDATGGAVAGGAAGVTGYALNPVIDMRMPKIQTSFVGIFSDMAMTTPLLAVEMSGQPGLAGVVDMTTPLLDMAMEGGVSEVVMTTPLMTVSFIGNVGTLGAVDMTTPHLAFASSGNPASVGSMALHMPLIRQALAGTLGGVGSIDMPLRPPRMVLSGSSGKVATLAMTMRMPRMALEGYSEITGVMAMRMPVVRIDMLGTLRAQLRLMLAVNTVTGAATTYEGLQTNSMCVFRGVSLFADATGIHAVDADNDNDVNIDARFQTGNMNMGSNQQKRVTDVYAGMRADGDINVLVSVDEQPTYTYVLQPLGVSTLKQRRVPTGKGLRGKYWQFEFANTNGCDFDFDSITIHPAETDRRI